MAAERCAAAAQLRRETAPAEHGGYLVFVETRYCLFGLVLLLLVSFSHFPLGPPSFGWFQREPYRNQRLWDQSYLLEIKIGGSCASLHDAEPLKARPFLPLVPLDFP